MRRIGFLSALCLPVALSAQAPASTASPLEACAFLKGTWAAEADATGATGEFSFEPGLDGKVLIRRNRAAIPAQNGRPAAVHEDLMLVYPEGGALKADYWDNEGHVIRYALKSAPGSLEFTSSGPGPRFRLSYRLLEKDRVEVSFAIATPDQPEVFKPYLSGRARRVK